MRSRASRSSPCAAIPACRSTTSRSRSRPSRSRCWVTARASSRSCSTCSITRSSTRPQAVAAGPVERVSVPPAPPRRVLVIEDNPDARNALRALLEVWGHQVEVAEDGPLGFEMALASRPDVVVVDIALPGLDAYHVAHGLRTALGADTGLLIPLTGRGQPDDRRRALEAGFDLHLVKPVDPQVLSEALARAPGRGTLHQP